MKHRLAFTIQSQPDDTTCGATCLQALYAYHGDEVSLGRLVREVPQLPDGGTLAVHLAVHALRRGYRARIYTYNLQVFDPTWFELPVSEVPGRLEAQLEARDDAKLEDATKSYLEFLRLGGEIRLEDLKSGLIRRHLKQGTPILTGLSATYLYRTAREVGRDGDHDDIRGEPAGHFVVLCGIDARRRTVLLADPYEGNPVSPGRVYEASMERVICSILLGIITYDANLLVLEPGEGAAPAGRRRPRLPQRGKPSRLEGD